MKRKERICLGTLSECHSVEISRRFIGKGVARHLPRRSFRKQCYRLFLIATPLCTESFVEKPSRLKQTTTIQRCHRTTHTTNYQHHTLHSFDGTWGAVAMEDENSYRAPLTSYRSGSCTNFP